MTKERIKRKTTKQAGIVTQTSAYCKTGILTRAKLPH